MAECSTAPTSVAPEPRAVSHRSRASAEAVSPAGFSGKDRFRRRSLQTRSQPRTSGHQDGQTGEPAKMERAHEFTMGCPDGVGGRG
jgi:hypothetical protein